MLLVRFAAANLIPSLLAGAIAWFFVRLAVRTLHLRDSRRRLALYGIPVLKSALVLLGTATILPRLTFLRAWQAAAVPWETAIPCGLIWAGGALLLQDVVRRRTYQDALRGATPAAQTAPGVAKLFDDVKAAYNADPSPEGLSAETDHAGTRNPRHIAEDVTIMVSREISVPMVLTEPDNQAVLLPTALVGQLNEDELRGVIAHELAHLVVSRPGFSSPSWWSLLTPLSPIAFFISRDIQKEVELACDACVANLLTRPESYAEALIKVYRFARAHPVRDGLQISLVPRLTGAKPAITERVEVLLRDQSVADARWLQACVTYLTWWAAWFLLF